MRLLAIFVLLALVQAQSLKPNYSRVLSAFLSGVPFQVPYEYQVTGPDLDHSQDGNLILAGPYRFRVMIWDKLMAADGSSLYIHDSNTGQTVIDSLDRNQLSPWLALLQGEIASGIEIYAVGSLAYRLVNSEPRWEGILELNPDSSLRYLEINEEAIRHQLRFSRIVSISGNIDSLLSLQDVPATILDLR